MRQGAGWRLASFMSISHCLYRSDFLSGEAPSLQLVVLKSLCSYWAYSLNHLKHDFSISPDLSLGMMIKSERKEVEKIVQIDFPVELSIN